MGSHSLLLLDDEDHVRMRRQLMPAFSGQALRGYAGMVRELAARRGREVAGRQAVQGCTSGCGT